MLRVNFTCDKEILASIDNIFEKNPGKFANKSHLIRQMIVRGIDNFYEEDKTFDKFLTEVFTPNQDKKKLRS